MKLDKVSYIPVLNGSILNCALREDTKIGDKRITFYTKDGLFRYNKYLINPFHHDKLFEQIVSKGLINSEEDVCFSDSGGLQATTLGETRHSPEEVFKWQQQNTQIGFSVDSIPFITDGPNTTPGSFGGWTFDKSNFIKHAEKSKDNIEATKRFKDNSKKFWFYGIIQGRNYNEYLRWYEVLRDDSYLDGYCCKAPNVNPMSLAQTAIFVMNNINKPVHFLGIGNMSRAIVLYYASRHLKQPISYDSSSYDIGTQYRWYHLPFMFNKKIRLVSPHNINEDKEIANEHDILHIKRFDEICDCVACRNSGDTIKMLHDNDPKLGGLLSLHNLIINIRVSNYVQQIINNPYKLKEFVNFNYEIGLATKILNAFDMIDLSVERGVDYALNKYKDDEQLNKSSGDQRGIFDF